jgi:hypothetical protein
VCDFALLSGPVECQAPPSSSHRNTRTEPPLNAAASGQQSGVAILVFGYLSCIVRYDPSAALAKSSFKCRKASAAVREIECRSHEIASGTFESPGEFELELECIAPCLDLPMVPE